MPCQTEEDIVEHELFEIVVSGDLQMNNKVLHGCARGGDVFLQVFEYVTVFAYAELAQEFR